MYAILDIETTGGQFNEEGITEIAIYKFDGHEVVDQFISLINPEIPIQPFVIKLTGINNAMLRSAPKFYEVAKRIIEITEGCIVVAHNASFDYRVIRTEFKRLGYDFVRETLCTVDLSKKLLPEQASYSLGKLVRSLGIPIADRHRASGDAMATVKLFKVLLAKDTNKEILTGLVKSEIDSGISPKLLDILDKVPSKTGIYYIHNEQGAIIYIAKSKNMKRKVNQHFTQNSKKALRIQKEVFTITYEETGSELLASLKEVREIEINKPKYNKVLLKSTVPFALYKQKNKDGYYGFRILKKDKRRKEITCFATLQEGEKFLDYVTEKFQLCKHVNLDVAEHKPCTAYSNKKCLGACLEIENKKAYNARVEQFIETYNTKHTNFIVIDKGRTIEERSAIWVENKKVLGYCFFNLNHQINKLNILKNIITPLDQSNESFNIVESFVRKKELKMIPY
ncbi:GIY-YIG nuclease family protein [Flavobacterium agricola]|uniref:GIY-YIG nuclease family protein n=1 Tax=Flavobacterium agricola TaxID=2870839 RepID=A0ABY6M2B3_9FLAO|nr:exonuclease domain-containing protein [Flavobacterium agricola]UYW01860.1 GIY-YIG nuclease family protein [Flavobacterium agricola]